MKADGKFIFTKHFTTNTSNIYQIKIFCKNPTNEVIPKGGYGLNSMLDIDEIFVEVKRCALYKINFHLNRGDLLSVTPE